MLDTGFHLLVSLHEIGLLGDEVFLAFAQRTILVLQASTQLENFLQAFFEALEFLAECGFFRHAANYRTRPEEGQLSARKKASRALGA